MTCPINKVIVEQPEDLWLGVCLIAPLWSLRTR